MSSQEDEEEPIVEYARFYGLSIDPLRDPSPLSLIESLFYIYEKDVSEDSHLPQINYQPILPSDEPLTIDKGAEILLAGANGVFLDQGTIDKITTAASVRPRRQKPKLELPLLRTDPDADLEDFRQRQNPCISDESFIYEPHDIEKDEGIQWPSRFADLPNSLTKDCSMEKITVTRDTMVYLQAALKDNWSKEDTKDFLASQPYYKRNPALDPITPPLSTLCWATPEPFEPSSPTCHLPLLSDPPSQLGADLEAAERAIFEDDELLSVKEESSDYNDPIEHHQERRHNLRNIYFETSSLPSDELFPAHEHHTSHDLKVETPLTPPLPLVKNVTFSDTVEEMLFDKDCPGFTSSANDSGDADSFFMNHTLHDTFREAYNTENSRLEKEQLQEAATTGRVEVPIMDFTAPNPPWNVSKLSGFKKTLSQPREIVKSILKEIKLSDRPKALRKLNHTVDWTVFPTSLAEFALIEEFGNEDALLRYTNSEMETDITTSVSLTYKAPGIRILRDVDVDDEDDEDLEPGVFLHEELDMASLIKKRKLELGEMGENGTQENIQESGNSTVHAAAKKHSWKLTPGIVADSDTANEGYGNSGYGETLIGGVFSATTAVDNFIEMRGTKRHKPTDSTSSYLSSPKAKAVHTDNPVAMPIPPPIVNSRLTKADIPLPLSNITVPTETTQYIISTDLLKQRPLFSAIKSLIPTAHFIERDFNRYNTTAWLRQGTISRSPVRSPLAAEADLILSPSTGVVLTTLMKIKQKPLPGQKEKSEIKSKVEGVCMRYERLLVFISEASPDESSVAVLGGQECMAMAEFTGFCASLPCTVIVSFVPGAHKTLANWVVASMVRYGTAGSNTLDLLEDETQWEVFLRRCGMNPYAAQAVVSALKALEGVHSSRRGMFGISAFVGMEHNERIRMFGPVLAGERVLRRVSSVIDSRWRHDTP
ncbi:hypothetical protein VC83_06835 [Pseudogymnoascus destructans]|uniref:Uncharacterized protein n=2 Tax=Pseudogymnoascus destructans TaxID=655981 RepID=L8GB00_PSED2|nr:uncharacterized protein VC83_06835 [Pseudogymnoascus destructans]ELR09828.1 hypothetical protein GMDG_04311 [Pseudogymnoascus destructans 20631-21]OAF56423.1 hypothetical protein VC83_06835 [Pseudogymnoascus destructans]